MKAIIFDVDGTLSNPDGRVYMLDGEPDWEAFFADMINDPVIEPIAMLARLIFKLRNLGEKIAVIIVTARPARSDWEQDTLAWLKYSEIPYDRIYMRPEGDTRSDAIIKQQILERIIDDGYEPILAIDDRASVVKMWRDHGITTLQCAADEPATSSYAGQTLLHMMVGPPGGGKSHYAHEKYKPHEIVSTDKLRIENFGDMGHDPVSLKRVWTLAHGMVRARLSAGLFTVLDATNLKQEDRMRVLDILPRGIFCRYIVQDRELGLKLKDLGWRTEEMVMKYHRLFRKEEKNILEGDQHPYVTVKDVRPADSRTSR